VMACGALPVVCRGGDILGECLPAEVFPELRAVDASARSIAAFGARYMQDNEGKAEMSERVHTHYLREWSTALSPAGVAQSILNVYHSRALSLG